VIDIRAIILDFDGVLIESNEAKTQAFADLFALYPGYSQAMMNYHLKNFSTARKKKFEYYVFKLMNRPGDVAMVETMARQFSELVYSRVMACLEVPGAREFLEEFSRKVSLYIASVTPQDELRRIVRSRSLERYFIDIFGDPPVTKTEAIDSVLQREALTPQQVLFIGDSISDYEAAKTGGIHFIGRESGRGFQPQEVCSYPDLFQIRDVLRKSLKIR